MIVRYNATVFNPSRLAWIHFSPLKFEFIFSKRFRIKLSYAPRHDIRELHQAWINSFNDLNEVSMKCNEFKQIQIFIYKTTELYTILKKYLFIENRIILLITIKPKTKLKVGFWGNEMKAQQRSGATVMVNLLGYIFFKQNASRTKQKCCEISND